MRIYFTLLFTIISLSAFAKNIITGTVAEASDRSPIVGANVLIKDSNGKMLTYGISDDGGRFSIETPDGAENLYIQVTMIGYKTFSAPCKANAQPWTILMEEGALQLQEVVVKADRIRENGDTITYNVGSFAQKQDRTIGDVLKRMPGIDVANNGRI